VRFVTGDLRKSDGDVVALLLERLAVPGKNRQEAVHLGRGVLGRLVHVHQLPNFGKRQSEAFATQRQL